MEKSIQYLYSTNTWEQEETIFDVDLPLIPVSLPSVRITDTIKVKKSYDEFESEKSHKDKCGRSMDGHTNGSPYNSKEYNENFVVSNEPITPTGNKTFLCSHCGKGFGQNCQLKRHMISHTGEKRFKCTHCGKAFAHNVHLKDHMVTHTGENSSVHSVVNVLVGRVI